MTAMLLPQPPTRTFETYFFKKICVCSLCLSVPVVVGKGVPLPLRWSDGHGPPHISARDRAQLFRSCGILFYDGAPSCSSHFAFGCLVCRWCSFHRTSLFREQLTCCTSSLVINKEESDTGGGPSGAAFSVC